MEVIIITCDKLYQPVESRRNCILDILKKIDQSQKEAIIESDIVGCRGRLLTKAYDTKPVILTVACGDKFTAYLGVTPSTTNVFRVEEVTNECCYLRALERNGRMIQCTKYTCTLLMSAIIGIQCLEPINCQIEQGDPCNYSN